MKRNPYFLQSIIGLLVCAFTLSLNAQTISSVNGCLTTPIVLSPQYGASSVQWYSTGGSGFDTIITQVNYYRGAVSTSTAYWHYFSPAMDSYGNIYLASSTGNTVEVHDTDGYWIHSYGTGVGGSGANQLNQPESVWVDASDNVYVCDNYNGRIQKFAPGAATATTVVSNGGVTLVVGDNAGNIYFYYDAYGYQKVMRYNLSTHVLTQIQDIAGNYISNFTTNSAGDIFYLTNSTVKKIDHITHSLSTYLTWNYPFGTLAEPNEIIVEPNGDIYYSDSYLNGVFKYNSGANNYSQIFSFNNGSPSISHLYSLIKKGSSFYVTGKTYNNIVSHFRSIPMDYSFVADSAGSYYAVYTDYHTNTNVTTNSIGKYNSISVYPDNDGDGYGGGTSTTVCAATAPSGHTLTAADCNDANNLINPHAAPGVSVSNLGSTNVTINWLENQCGLSQSFIIRRKLTSGGVWSYSSANGTNSSKTFTTLLAGTGYTVQVRGYIGVNDTGLWSAPFNFTTSSVCNPPSAIVAYNVTSTTATVSWTGGTFAKVILQYKPVGTPVWFSANLQTNQNPYQINGLTPNTLYVFRFKTKCSSSITSAYSSLANFTTGTIRLGDVENNDTNILPEMNAFVSPNPVINSMLISGDVNFTGNVKISVLDIAGRVIYTSEIAVDGNEFVSEIDLSNQLPGLYLVCLTNENGLINTLKVVKQ